MSLCDQLMLANTKMLEKTIFLTLFLFAVSTAATITPQYLIDGASRNIQELTKTVSVAIKFTKNDIQNYYNDFQDYSNYNKDDGSSLIDLQEKTFETKIKQIKKLSGKEVLSCFDQDVVQKLASIYKNQMSSCIDRAQAEAAKAVKYSTQLIDSIPERIEKLKHEVDICEKRSPCIYTLIDQIEKDKVVMVDEIYKQMSVVDKFLAELKVSSKSCRDNSISEFIFNSKSVFDKISKCVNGK